MASPILSEDEHSITFDHPSGPIQVAKSGLDPAFLAELQGQNSTPATQTSLQAPQLDPSAAPPAPSMPAGASGSWGDDSSQASPKVEDVAPQAPQAQAPEADPSQYTPAGAMGSIGKAFDEEKRGTQAEGKALSDRSTLESKALTQASSDMAKTEEGRQARDVSARQAVTTQTQNFQNSYDHFMNQAAIDPNRAWNNSSAGAKITASLGIILGGIGGAMTGHGGNAALDVINKTIDRDIESQKLEIEKNKSGVEMQGNLLSQMRSQLGDDRAADAATRIIKLGAVDMQLKQIAAQTGSPLVLAQAQKASGVIDAQKQALMAPLQQMMYSNQLKRQLQGGGATDQNINIESPFMDKETRERVVNLPGGKFALAKTGKQAEDTQKAFTSMDTIDHGVDDALKFSHDTGRTLPFSDQNAVSNNIRDSLILELNKLHDLNRLNPQEFETFSEMVPKPGAWRQDKAVAQLMTLRHLINNKRASEMSNNLEGFDPRAAQSKEGLARR